MEVRVLAPTGVLGAGFKESSLRSGMDRHPHVIACDGGSTDSGPYYLGSGTPRLSREATKHDLRLLLQARNELDVPLIIGSCGTSGSDPALDWLLDIYGELAREVGLHPRTVIIRSEQQRDYLLRRFREGRLRPLETAPPLNERVISNASHVVGMMGHEPIDRALREGAEVVLAGRASDTALFVAVPLQLGAPAGLVWHAAKTIECGAACAGVAAFDSVFATVRDDHFLVEPLDPDARCTPLSVAAHTLYENSNPFLIREPSGVLDTSDARYEAADDRTVRVSGSIFREAETYTIKLEAAELVGHQTVIIGGIRDPYVIRRLDDAIPALQAYFRNRVRELFGADDATETYRIQFRVYGRNGVMGDLEPDPADVGHEVGLLVTITAETQAMATSIAKFVSHMVAHFSIPEWQGIISTVAYPFSPPYLERGPVYRFSMNHVCEPDNPYEMFPMEFLQT